MKKLSIICSICVLALTASQALATTGIEYLRQGSPQNEKHKIPPGKKKTNIRLETGITTGTNLSMGSYFSVGMFGTRQGRIKMGAFLSYNRCQLQQHLEYQNTFSFLSNSYNNLIRETREYETRMIEYRIEQLNFYEIGIQGDYELGSRATIFAGVSLNFMQDIRGKYTDYSIDSIFEVSGAYRDFQTARQEDIMVQEFREVDFKGLGLEHTFSAHFGGTYSFTNRWAVTSRMSLPLGELFPEKIYYSGNAVDQDVVLTKNTSYMAKRPLFIRLGLAYTF